MTAARPSPVALVTDGASCMGAAIVQRLCGDGHRVVVADLDEAAAARVAAQLSAPSSRATLSTRPRTGGYANTDPDTAEAPSSPAARERSCYRSSAPSWLSSAHATGRLHPDIGASDFAVIPLSINPVVGASEGAIPDLWRRWLAIVLKGIATGPRTTAFPGHSPDVNDVEEIITKSALIAAARSGG